MLNWIMIPDEQFCVAGTRMHDLECNVICFPGLWPEYLTYPFVDPPVSSYDKHLSDELPRFDQKGSQIRVGREPVRLLDHDNPMLQVPAVLDETQVTEDSSSFSLGYQVAE